MSQQGDKIVAGLQLLKEIEREADNHLAQQRMKMAAVDVALYSGDPKQLETARSDLLSVMEAGIDMKIRNFKKMRKFEEQLG